MPDRFDNFNRANTTSGLGTPSDGGSNWIPYDVGGGASWGIDSNQAYDVYDANSRMFAVLDSGSPNAIVQVTLATFGNPMGLVLRASDINNAFVLACNTSPDGFRLLRLNGGSFDSLLGQYVADPASSDIVTVVMNGNSFEVFVNGVSRIGPVSDSFNNSATQHGLFGSSSYFNGQRWDYFSITNLRNVVGFAFNGLQDVLGTLINVAGTSPGGDHYPVTRGGFTFGWDLGLGGTVTGTNRNTNNPPNLIGVNFVGGSGDGWFRVDLTPGTYDISLAIGDAAGSGTLPGVTEIYDNSTLLWSVTRVSDTAQRFTDSQGNEYTENTWGLSNQVKSANISTGTLYMHLTGSSFPLLAYLGIDTGSAPPPASNYRGYQSPFGWN